MPSSRGSSPASDSATGSPGQLSPRSKVRAMLAALDGDSDGETSLALKDTAFVAASKAQVDLESIPEQALEARAAGLGDIEGSEDEDVPIKPRGRLAVRMNAVDKESTGEGGKEIDTARERVKKMLLTEMAKETKSPIETQENGSSEVEDLPVPSRKRKIRRPRGSTPESIPAEQHSSPGELFVSSAENESTIPSLESAGSDSDLPENPVANARFMALVAKKRQERLAREKEINQQKAEKAAEREQLEKTHSDMLEADAAYGSDEENGGRKLTQQVRPTRKASKKALEDMHRETQRISRNMQLAHEARTKKKITKSSLFARFNYKPVGFVEEQPAPPASSSSPRNTDIEMRDTPPTSPTYHDGLPKPTVTENILEGPEAHCEDSTELSEALSKTIPSSPPMVTARIDKGKGKVADQLAPVPTAGTNPKTSTAYTQKPIRIRPPKFLEKPAFGASDSDSDLEVVTTTTSIRDSKKESVFDRIPAKKARESHSLHALRMLAHLTSPGKEVRRRNAKPSMTATELTMSLQQRARQQATRERDERLQALRDRGVIVQTAEEREQEMADVEDLLSKARREGEELVKKEKEARKRDRKANGEVDPLGGSSDDEEWQEEKEEFAEQMSASGSDSDDADGEASNEDDLEEEDEEEEGDVGSADDEVSTAGNLLDNEASESETEEDGAEDLKEGGAATEDSHFIDDGDDELPAPAPRRRTKQLVVSDDEEEATPVKPSRLLHVDSPLDHQSDSPVAPHSVLRSATKTFIPGLTVAGPAGLGLTQIFAGTMDDSQTQTFDGSPGSPNTKSQQYDSAQDSLAFLRNFPPPDFPAFEPTMEEDSQDLIKDSQTQISQFPDSPLVGRDSQDIQLGFTQSQIHGFDSLAQDPFATQLSEFPEPTQDGGFQEMSPIKGRFIEPPPSTVDTVIIGETPVPDRSGDSPIAKRKGKLHRRAQMPTFSDDEDEAAVAATVEDDEFDISANVFDVMRKASKKKEVVIDDFDKKKSGAKEMVHEQAEESEDEYHGLGGASDDESGGEEDAFVKEMIDDEAGKDADERQLAAFYADKERANDSKQVEKLFRDITNGTLRRKRGADYSLSDSDDDGEARRRMKRREFAKMRKALLEDEAIGKIAENPKKLAFLRAIEDRGGDDEMDFLDDFADSQDMGDSQSQSQAEASEEVSQVDDSQPGSVPASIMGPPKRKLSSDADPANRLPPNQRRTKPTKRPSNLSEIRESLSSLIEAPNAVLAAAESSDSEGDADADADSELEIENAPKATRQGEKKHKEKENRDPFAPRRSNSISVVDRISLKRASSSNLSTSARLAFAASSSTPGFKVPALLRRATTNSSISSVSSSSLSGAGSSVSGMERSAGGFADDGRAVAKKAGKNSGVQYMARENERKIKLVEGEKKREEKRWKGAVGRRKVVGGLFGMGKFE